MNGSYTKEQVLDMFKYKNHFSIYDSVKPILKYDSSFVENVFLSFVIPTYNRCDFLYEALSSIYSQIGLEKINYEVIVTDNSGDLSEQNKSLMMVMENRFPNMKYYVNEDNIGACGNLNRCVELAKGEYISMLLDDDLLTPQYLGIVMTTINWLKLNNKRFCGIKTGYHRFSSNQKKPDIPKYEKVKILPISKINCLFNGIGPSSCPTCGMIFDRDSFIKTGGLYEELGPGGDHMIGYMMMERNRIFYSVLEATGYYRLADNESMKIETNIGFCKSDYYLREYMYSENFLRKIFGILFREVQYYESVNGLIKNAKDFNLNLNVEDMDFMGTYKYYPLRMFIFKICRKINNFCRKNYVIELEK